MEFRVREVATGRDLPDHLRWIKFSDGRGPGSAEDFSTDAIPSPQREAMVIANRDMKLSSIGWALSRRMIFWCTSVPIARSGGGDGDGDGRYLMVTISEGSDIRTREYYADLGRPETPEVKARVVPLLDDYDAAYTMLGNDGPVFYFQTTQSAPRGPIIAVDTRRPGPSSWREVVP